MKETIISIITPSFNQSRYIEDTIKSVICQEGNFWIDYIIIDGKSNDGSVEIIKSYENKIKSNITKVYSKKGTTFYTNEDKKRLFNKCKGISYRWVSEKDKGHGDALNKGFKEAIGNILAWINSDDMYHKGAFQYVTEIFEKYEDIYWITGKNTWFDKRGRVIGEKLQFVNRYDYLLKDFNWIQQESTFWKKQLWEKVGSYINNNYKLMVDGELWCRFFLVDEIWHVDKCLGGYRIHELNRAKKKRNEVYIEINNAIDEMRRNISEKDEKIIKTILDARTYSEIEAKITDQLRYNVLKKDNGSWKKIQYNYFVYKESLKAKRLMDEINKYKLSRSYKLINIINKLLTKKNRKERNANYYNR